MSSRKLVVAIGVATVGLTLIGLGVRASFTTTATVDETISTGNVNALITDLQWQTVQIDGGLTPPIEVGGAPFSPGVSSASFGTSANNGSSIDEIFTFTLKNTGSLDMSLTCAISAGASDSQALTAELIVDDPNATGAAFGTLASVETNGTNVCAQNTDVVAAGATVKQSIELASQSGGLSNDAMGASISPSLTVTGAEISGGLGNAPH